ncbi:MAG: hypothetical protein BWK80_08585 [Desulfobacteraceae bacterium IS3]|nr:MAG: hypothetical protein BWK80_08585 [Desulfobacteraceae bacterium IS3]
MRYFIILLKNRTAAICLLYVIFGANPALSETLSVFVSIVPQKYFVEKVGGDLVNISVMASPGADVHTFEPKPKQMVELGKAKIYFAIGIEFENAWLGKFAAANPLMLIVQTDKGIEKISMQGHGSHDEHEAAEKGEHGHGHHHGSADPHIWLSPRLVKVQAINIRDALVSADPANHTAYKTNCEKFLKEIDELDAEIKKLFSEKGGKVRFMAFHPSWAYFARDYGLDQIPVEIEGKNPGPAQLKDLIVLARKLDIKTIFVPPMSAVKIAESLAKEIGGQLIAADPLAADWAKNLRETAGKFKAALK